MEDKSTPTIQRISSTEMCEKFNSGNYWNRAVSGEFAMVLMADRHPSLTLANEPYCTRSQMVSYRDKMNNEIARVHQYLRTDGSIGASGKPDPKRLFEGGILFRLPKKPKV
jgi:hypothetical protein